MRRKDLTGRMFGRLTVLQFGGSHKTPTGQSKAMWICKCECGNIRNVQAQALTSGTTNSCGCLRREIVSNLFKSHGMVRSPTYQSWRAMRERCNNSRNTRYANYGGRGIKVCDAWQTSFETFLADMGERPSGTTLERIDVNKQYEPKNCKWATAKEQARNTTRNVVVEWRGERKTAVEWAADMNITAKALRVRLQRWPLERAMTGKRHQKKWEG